MDSDTTVLIQGESGVGKELIARALHYGGPRKDKSFVAVNCSALPEGVLETELFGHVKGAFTGALRNRIGKFELANGGTLFLDEIGEISLSTQVKLLRVIEEREFQRIGDNTNIKLDIRLITATNKDLYQKTLEGAFRDDLYFRLSVYPLDLPPLRERIDDIPLLTSHFIRKFNQQMGASVMGIADKVLDILESYHWPGNVRELGNAIEHAFVHRKKSLIYPCDLPYSIVQSVEQPETRRCAKVRKQVDLLEKDLIMKQLDASKWNKSVAAKKLSMSRTTLWRKMKKHGIAEQLHN
jgi:transcriptional regulator with GAF, ATPase, and Fis domain